MQINDAMAMSAQQPTVAPQQDDNGSRTDGRYGLWTAVVAGVALSGLGITYYAASVVSPTLFLYGLRPVLFLLPAVIAFVVMRPLRRFIFADRSLALAALCIGFSQVVLSFMLGAVYGFGHSPYPHSGSDVLLYVWYLGSLIVGYELARWFVARALQTVNEVFAFVVTWLLFWATSLSVNTILNLNSGESAFEYVGRVVLPAMAMSLIATCLVTRGSAIASMLYMAPVLSVEWFSPILPNLPWLVVGFVGVIVPVFGIALLSPALAPDTEGEADEVEEIGPSWSVIGISTMLLGLFWLNTGLLGVQPSLVNGHSMEPNMYTGDVAIIRDVEPAELKVGDVIKFSQNGHFVLHRIIEIQNEGGALVFITQGDNNRIVDEPVPEAAVTGRLLLNVPKVGWVGIVAKQIVSYVLP